MAEYAAKHLLNTEYPHLKHSLVSICSRGTNVARGGQYRGAGPHDEAVKALQLHADIRMDPKVCRAHTPTALQDSLKDEVTTAEPDAGQTGHEQDKPQAEAKVKTYFICMTSRHRDEVMAACKAREGCGEWGVDWKAFLLVGNGTGGGLPDPFNAPLEEYQECLDVVVERVRVILENLSEGREPLD